MTVHLSVVTVCMNRQMHLTETAPRVQAWADALGLAWEHVVVDWNSTVPLIRESLPASGSLRLIRVQGEQEWCAARAYNFACAQAKGELLMRLDADCWPERLIAEQLEQLSAGDVLEGALAGGSEGSWLMHRQLFEDVGGFHELLRGYGCEDIDLRARLKLRGARINTLSPEAIRVIRHESDLRVGLVQGNMSRSAAAIARAWKDALVEANRWAVVQHPWSVHRPHTAWLETVNKKNPKIKSELNGANGKLDLNGLENLIRQEKDKHFETKPSLATRQCSMAAIEKISAFLPELIGGSADLSGSNNTKTNNSKIINSKNFNGNYIHYGVREHGMAAVMNGLALYGGIIPYGGTFLIFSDYCKPSIRLSALMGLKVIYVFSHDSIGLGEDGPTHQPIEQLAGLRAIPNLNVFRPADINETFECWEIALKSENNPSAIALSRQKVPYINPSNSKENKCEKGAYVVNLTSHESSVTLVASGTEVELALKVQDKLKENNIHSKVVSMPCMELFDKQPEDYRKDILEENSLIVTLEAGSVMSWQKYIKNKGANLGINKFGESAPYKEVYKHFKLSEEDITNFIQKKLRE